MGYIREPKNVDFVVGPSVFNEATRQTIVQAIEQYKKTGQNSVSVAVTPQDPAEKEAMHIDPAKITTAHSERASKRRTKI